jgi:hypothetical protein
MRYVITKTASSMIVTNKSFPKNFNVLRIIFSICA